MPYRINAAGIAASGPWRLAGDGVLMDQHGARTVTFAGTGHVRRADLRTVTPVEARFSGPDLSAHADLAIGSGRADIKYQSRSGALTASADVTGLGLVLLDPDLVGQVSGAVALAGQGDRLTGDLKAQLVGAGGRDLKGSPPANGIVTARLASGAVHIDAQFANSQGLKASADVALPAKFFGCALRVALNTRKPISAGLPWTAS